MKLTKTVTAREIDEQELERIHKPHFNRVFANRTAHFFERAEPDKLKQRRHSYPLWQLRIGLYQGDAVVGWHFGFAPTPDTYYMQNSVVLEEYRNQKIYSALLDFVLKRVEQEDFQVITSLHHPNNAAVLIPKLKRGFVIASMQCHERFGNMIEMKYFFNESQRKAFGKSAGLY
jgi:ribosomal protein S18 acetylase RimI-like enzyme